MISVVSYQHLPSQHPEMIFTILSPLLPLLTLVRGDNQPSYAAPGGRQGGAGDPIDALGETIPGEPGEDYPIYSSVPETSFQCDGRTPGIVKQMYHSLY